MSIDEVREIVRRALRGDYQADLLAGRQKWSGADLRGKAGKWAAQYARSRQRLVERANTLLWEAGSDASLEVGLVLGPSRRFQTTLMIRWDRIGVVREYVTGRLVTLDVKSRPTLAGN